MPVTEITNFRYVISPSRLTGEVILSGAKNSVLRLMAATLLTSESVRLLNYPDCLLDAQIHVEMLRVLGKKCTAFENQLLIEEHQPLDSVLRWQGRSIRNTLLILGCLLSRTGAGKVPLPGGCKLGERKYDLHEMIFRRLGADVWEEDGSLCASCSKRLQGAEIHLPLRSTGATENAILCGTLAEGVTRVWNPHIRPEILDLINCLRSMGAHIKVYGQEHIEIRGVESLRGTSYHTLPDNMEALTWMVAAVITGGAIEIHNFPYDALEVPLIHLRESGARFFRGPDSVIVRGGRCYPLEISTGPYPGINSDMQPLLAVYGAFAQGQSVIVDLRFPGRYGYADELAKMGMKYSIDGNLLRIQGGHPLHGTEVKALDLRAGIALALAALGAHDKETVLHDAWQVERGYNKFVSKLQGLGGKIAYA
jgi:UDP-N-acetylglucosamine 1-carboxyvinyltransferase